MEHQRLGMMNTGTPGVLNRVMADATQQQLGKAAARPTTIRSIIR
jgi:hypothetical protein